MSILLDMITVTVTDKPNDRPLTYLSYAVIRYNNCNAHGFALFELICGHTYDRLPEETFNQEKIFTRYVQELNNKIKV